MHTDITNEKNMERLVGGPLLVGGLGPGPLVLPLKSSPCGPSVFSARCNIYISRLCYDVSVRLSICDGSALAHYG